MMENLTNMMPGMDTHTTRAICWIVEGNYNSRNACDLCGCEFTSQSSNFCPRCGVKFTEYKRK